MVDQERYELAELALELERRAARFPQDSKWHDWMVRRARTCAAAAALPVTAIADVVSLDTYRMRQLIRRRRVGAAAALAAATLTMNVGVAARNADELTTPGYSEIPAAAVVRTPPLKVADREHDELHDSVVV